MRLHPRGVALVADPAITVAGATADVDEAVCAVASTPRARSAGAACGLCRPNEACYPLDVTAQGCDGGGQFQLAGFHHTLGDPLTDQR